MLKAKNNKGNRRETKLQLKRHISQMNENAIKHLVDNFNKLDKSNTKISKHLLNKKTITFNKEDIDKLLNKDIKDLIIEYNQTYLNEEVIDKRIVIRDKEIVETDKGKQNMCIVFSLTRNMVITVYYNPPDDNHTTIDINKYIHIPINGI